MEQQLHALVEVLAEAAADTIAVRLLESMLQQIQGLMAAPAGILLRMSQELSLTIQVAVLVILAGQGPLLLLEQAKAETRAQVDI